MAVDETPAGADGIPLVGAYRFQLTETDDFDAAAGLVPYLAELGISHLYTSPIAEAEPGSTHGYDVVDPTRVRAELGGEPGLRRLLDALARHGMGWILDIVPNHVSIATPGRNPWFWSVLEDGRGSPHAELFDIDWDAPADERLVLPVLSDYFERALAAGELTIDRSGERPELLVGGVLRLPLRSASADSDDRNLEEVLADQHYRLVFWQRSLRNMRRFFEIDTLAAVAVERPEARRLVHELLVRLLDEQPTLTGVRVDHLDGLADPDAYLRWLRALVGDGRTVHIEKILVGDESLPPRWPVEGTTGYEFARLVDQVLADADGVSAIVAEWRRHCGDRRPYHDVERAAVVEVLADRLAPDVGRLHRLLSGHQRLAGPEGRSAIVGLASHLGRYRTYLPEGGEADAAVLRRAAVRAVADGPERAAVLGDLLAVLTRPATAADREVQRRFQQLTGPALAKGGEDRALYRHVPLTAFNEVGGDPGTGGLPVEAFHSWARKAAADNGRALLTTTTHDTKRSGDVRARLVALSAHADAWRTFVRHWGSASQEGARSGGVDPGGDHPGGDHPGGDHPGGSHPGGIHAADDWLLLQTVLGAWPIDADRLVGYLHKALREAAQRSSWIQPDEAYEVLVKGRVDSLLENKEFVDDVEAFVDRLDEDAFGVSLAQVVLRLTAPGVGDVYRGDELFDRSLVDPDNRRPVDWARYRRRLVEAQRVDLDGARSEPDGLAKMVVIVRTLALRARHLDAFGVEGPFTPLAVDDPALVTYGRGPVLVAVRRPGRGPHRPFDLPPGSWRHVLVDGREPLSGTVATGTLVDPDRPVAVLEQVTREH